MNTRYTIIETPMGQMTLQANDEGLLGAWFETQTTQPEQLGEFSESDPILNNAIKQLGIFFRRKNWVQSAACCKRYGLPTKGLVSVNHHTLWGDLELSRFGQCDR